MAELQEEIPTVFKGHARRLSEATVAGISIVNQLIDDAAPLQSLVSEVVTLPERDPRFRFLEAIPDAPVLAMTRAQALERSVFEVETREVAELSLLMGLFTVILDGLLDEAPSELQPAQAWLDAIMDPNAWRPEGSIPAMGLVEHPVTQALGWLTREVITRVVSSGGWRNDSIVRDQFSRATLAAYNSELRSTDCRITRGAYSIDESRRRILAKSTNAIWAGSLIPFCVHGWPAQLAPTGFAKAARAIGAFGGWIDDVVDVAVDLRADRWSMVLFELHDAARFLTTPIGSSDPRPAMLEALSLPFIAGRLASIGVDRLRGVRSELAAIAVGEAELLPILADVAEVGLTDGLQQPKA